MAGRVSWHAEHLQIESGCAVSVSLRDSYICRRAGQAEVEGGRQVERCIGQLWGVGHPDHDWTLWPAVLQSRIAGDVIRVAVGVEDRARNHP